MSWLVSINEEVKCYWSRKNASKSVRKETPVHADWNLFAVKQLTKRTYGTPNHIVHTASQKQAIIYYNF